MNLQDAIYEFLGIPLAEQPADCYRLLGLARFEPNSEVISNAAARQMLFVRQLATGQYSQVSQDLLDLLAEAKARLLNPERRRQYDAKLRRDAEELPNSLTPPATEAAPITQRPSIESIESNPIYSAEGSVYFADGSVYPSGQADQERPVESIPVAGGPLPSHAAESGGGTISRLASPAYANPAPRVISDSHLRAPVDCPDTGAACAAGLADDTSRIATPPREWVVGTGADCDIVVSCPYVSRRHCRISEVQGAFWVEDLGSRNGTHVNQTRVEGRQLVTAEDLVTLGTLARMPWPPETLSSEGVAPAQVQIVRIGRSSSNDVVLDDASVSRRHAQISVIGDRMVLEDLGSTNGTFVGDSALRVNRRRISVDDLIRIGRFSLPASHLLGAESVV